MNGTIDLESDLIMVVWDLDEMVFQKKLVTVMEVLQQSSSATVFLNMRNRMILYSFRVPPL